MNAFRIEILTPERTFFEGEIESLVVPTITGQMGILAGSMPIVTALVPGQLFFRQNEKEFFAANSDGFMETRGGIVYVFCQTVFWPHELNEKILTEKEERQRAALMAAETRKEYVLTQAALARTFAKLKVQKSTEHLRDK